MIADQPLPQRDESVIEGKEVLLGRTWFYLFRSLWLRTGGGNGAAHPDKVVLALTAEGTTQGDALALTTEWSQITTTPANSGVLLQDLGVGSEQWVTNNGANILRVYPPSGSEVDALGVNVGYQLPAGKDQLFRQMSTTAYRSTQLG